MPYPLTYLTPEVGTGVGQDMGWGQKTKTKTCVGFATVLSTGSNTELETKLVQNELIVKTSEV